MPRRSMAITTRLILPARKPAPSAAMSQKIPAGRTRWHWVTVNHVTGLEAVLPSGKVIELGGKAQDSTGLDLTGFFVGSEGTMGVVTRVTVKLTKLPEHVTTLLAIYNTVEDAANTVVAITQSGVTPAALEMLDGWMVRC